MFYLIIFWKIALRVLGYTELNSKKSSDREAGVMTKGIKTGLV